ncbi:hypothetical protein JW710_00780 [Candidatus Dojkabacteria bacterium]|nr:hypothetical protein [Candidatus Dojkabacteria bacterium]
MPEITLSQTGSNNTAQPKTIPLKKHNDQKVVKNDPTKSPVQSHKSQSKITDKPIAKIPTDTPKSNTTKQTQNTQQQTSSSSARQSNPPAQPPQPTQNPWQTGGNQYGSPGEFGSYGGFGGYGDLGGMNGMYGQQQQQKRLTPEERIQMIKTVYSEVLGREPDTRDINYYKYSTLDEEQIKKQLLTSAEHKELIEKGQEFNKIKSQSDQLQSRCKMLETQIKDQLEEFRELNDLLKEKNEYLQKIREERDLLPKPQPTRLQPQQTTAPAEPTPQLPSTEQAQQPTQDMQANQPTPQTLQPAQTDQPTLQTQPPQTELTSEKMPPPEPPKATFTDQIQPQQPSTSSRTKGFVADILSRFF